MNKKIIILIIGIILVVTLIVIILITKNNKSPKELEITKEINAGIPFKWEYVIEDPEIVEFKKSYVIRDDNKNGIVGASVYTNYVFKGLKEGVTKVVFKMVSITNEDYPSLEEVHTIKVDKDLNISEVKDKNE